MVTDRVLQDVKDAFSGCNQGDCKYPDPYKPPVDMLRVDRPPLCMGWWGTLYIEGQEKLVRYRRCPRHDAWWKEEQRRIRARKAADKAAVKGEAGRFSGTDE